MDDQLAERNVSRAGHDEFDQFGDIVGGQDLLVGRDPFEVGLRRRRLLAEDLRGGQTGSITATRTPSAANSRRSAPEKPITAHFVAL